MAEVPVPDHRKREGVAASGMTASTQLAARPERDRKHRPVRNRLIRLNARQAQGQASAGPGKRRARQTQGQANAGNVMPAHGARASQRTNRKVLACNRVTAMAAGMIPGVAAPHPIRISRCCSGRGMTASGRSCRAAAQRRLIIFAALGLLGLGAWTSYYTVPGDSVAVVQRFGKYSAVVLPGLHFKLPLGIDTATIVPGQAAVEAGIRVRHAGRDRSPAKSGSARRRAGNRDGHRRPERGAGRMGGAVPHH